MSLPPHLEKRFELMKNDAEQQEELFESLPKPSPVQEEVPKHGSYEYWAGQKKEVLGILFNWKARAKVNNKKPAEIECEKIIRFIEEITR
ncbi:MAG: hypothetical protein ACRC5H_03810 [Treponemataceae bacterium]